MKTIIITLISIFLLSFSSFGKTTYYPGKIIHNDGKVIEGKIGVVSPTYNEVKVKFINEKGKKKVYQPSTLTGYTFQVPVFNKATRKYEARWIKYERKTAEDAVTDFGSKEVFVEKAVDGAIEVFNHYSESNDKMSQKLNHFFYIEKDGELGFTKLTKKNYVEVLKALTADMPELSKLIGTPGNGYKYIAKISRTYNSTRGNRTPVMSDDSFSLVSAR